MAERLSAKSAWKLNNALKKSAATKPTKVGTARVTRRDSDGSVWVRLPGSNVDTPVNGQILSDAAVGDTVSVRIENGRLSLTGNASTPSVGQQQVTTIVQPVRQAADDALETASTAQTAAELATSYAASARQAADDAQASADDAADAAKLADDKAQAASDSALAANTAAQGALLGLSTVEDVVDVLAWLSAHSKATADTSIAADRDYYVRDASGAMARVESAVSPSEMGWHEAAQSDDVTVDAAKTYYELDAETNVLTPVSYTVDPSELGWYEATASTDTEAVAGKAYYELDEGSGTLTPVDEVPEDADPSELGWWEIAATADTETRDGKAYYVLDPETGWASPAPLPSPRDLGWWEVTASADATMSRLKDYYTVDSGTGVASPLDPSALGWWEMDDAVTQYLAAHLAMTDHGLNLKVDNVGGWMRIGTLEDNNEYGTYILDEQGRSLARLGEHTRIGRDDSLHVDITDGSESDETVKRLFSIANAGDQPVMYVEVNTETKESTVYMTNAVVVQNLRFGNWMWYERPNGNMSVKWMGDDS